MNGAFDGSLQIKQGLVDQLYQGLAQLPDPLDDWPSINELTVGSIEAQADVDATGYPESLVILQDELFATLIWSDSKTGFRAGALEAARNWLAVVPVGAQLSQSPTRLVAWLLERIALASRVEERSPALWGLLQEVLQAHSRQAEAGSVTRKEWAALRNRAGTLAQSTESGDLGWAFDAIEAAAWDPASSRVILTELANVFCQQRSQTALAEWGWTRDEADRIHAVLQGIFDETQPQRDSGEDVDIPSIFNQREPVMEARYVEHMSVAERARNEASLEIYQRAIFELKTAGAAQ